MLTQFSIPLCIPAAYASGQDVWHIPAMLKNGWLCYLGNNELFFKYQIVLVVYKKYPRGKFRIKFICAFIKYSFGYFLNIIVRLLFTFTLETYVYA
jgi:hypothetical protein